jgi:hypothetical protein
VSSLVWGDYLPFDAQVSGTLRDAPRDVAEAHFARLMAARAERQAALAAIVAANGATLDADGLGAWLQPALAAAGKPALDGDDAWRWSGLIADVALWLGEHIIATARAGGSPLDWALCVSHKKATGYQRPVLMGFRSVEDRNYYVDVAFMVASWADLAARGRQARPDFLATIARVTAADA